MNIKDLYWSIYRFYPRNLSNQDEKYYLSKEYIERKKRVNDAFHQNEDWFHFKALVEEFALDKSSGIADYSFGGGSVAYHLSLASDALKFKLDTDVIVFTILISVVSDFWTFRFMERSIDGYQARYESRNEIEDTLIQGTSELIERCFPKHKRLIEKFHQMTVDDVSANTYEERAPTVFELLFVDHDN